jgi:hypothetical protein
LPPGQRRSSAAELLERGDELFDAAAVCEGRSTAIADSAQCRPLAPLRNRLLTDRPALRRQKSGERRESNTSSAKRLTKAHDILSNVREAGAPEIATRHWWDRDRKLSPAEQKIVDKAEVTVWTRRDPMRSFQEGFESEHYTAFDREVLYGAVADYLKEPWLRHPYLDWIMVDMLVTRELSLFGENVKLGSPLGLGYFKAKGNLLKTKLWGALWAIAVPVGATYGAFHFGYGGIGTSLLTAYCIAIAAWLGLTLERFLAGKRPFVLWNEMYEVWKLLQGPIVNPTLVREVMAKTRDQGAVWDTPAWSIVDRVIQHDPADRSAASCRSLARIRTVLRKCNDLA